MKKFSVLFTGIISLVFLLMIGCQDPSSEGPTAVETNSAGITSGTSQVLSKSYSGINAPQLQKELALARSATARYHTLDSAIADGYIDIDVVVQNMGYHYMNKLNVKDTFDP
ncbi:MAG: hypothetical protein WCE54_02140, partial [Ignavibacteriaceae bacterium]